MNRLNPRIHQHWSLRDTVYRLVDLIGIVAGMWVASRWNTSRFDESHMLIAVIATVMFYLMSEFSGMYRNWRGVSAEQEVFCLALTWTATVACVLAFSVMSDHSTWITRLFVLKWSAATMIMILVTRLAIRTTQSYLRSKGFNSRGYAVVGINELGFELARRIEASPELGLRFSGFYDDRDDDRLPNMPNEFGGKLGTIRQLVTEANQGRVNMIYITFPMRAEDRIRGVLDQLSDTTASVYVVPDFFVFQMLHSRWTNINGLPAVSIFENPLYGVDGMLKRTFDIAMAAILLIAASIPMLLIALLVKLTSAGPIFFRQKRYGLDGREIMVWKFRSMAVCESGDSFTQATRNDPRTTTFGAFLRRTSLDELPQLFNVLEGSMSLVGPRPHASMQNEVYRKRIQGYMLRHKVKPGMTGLAQVNGWRGETDTLEKMARRVEFDHRYIREWSLLMDLKILFRTIFVVFSRQNAY